MAANPEDTQSSEGARYADVNPTSPRGDSENLPDRESSALLTGDSFTSTPLREPASWIRLLKYVLKGSSDPLATSLSAWKRTDAPPFNAISYAWGDATKKRSIVINGQRMTVRENCYYALWQARLYEPENYVWIDSICINQSDLHEKGLQVQMMGLLYWQANLVLVCVGPHADGSEHIVALGKHLEQLSDDDEIMLEQSSFDKIETNARTLGVRPSNARIRWILRQDEKDILSLHSGMTHFCQRPYWKRVWIVQEVAAARARIVLCGDEYMFWEGLIRARDTLGGMSDVSSVLDNLDTAPVRNVHMAAERQIHTLESLVRTFRGSKCTDPRDRLFAFSGLSDTLRIEADYTKSAFQLAVMLAEQQLVSEELLAALEVFHNDVDMRAAVRRRQKETSVDEAEHRGWGSRHRTRFRSKLNRVGELACDDSGGLLLVTEAVDSLPPKHGMDETETLHSRQAAQLTTHLEDLRNRSRVCPDSWIGKFPHEIRNQDGVLVGWTCNDAQAGDVLVPCNETLVVFATTTPYLLVLRPALKEEVKDDRSFDIVGQALLLPDFRLPWHQHGYVAPGQQPPALDGYSMVELYISAEDQVVFVGQDLAPSRDHDISARMARLFTSVSRRSKRAAFIHFRHYNNLEVMNIGASPDLQRSRS